MFITPKELNIMKSNLATDLFCSAFGHNYFRVNKLNNKVSSLVCKCCNKQFVSKAQNGEILDISLSHNKIVPLIEYL